jgi:hypothetical protein
MNKKKKFLSIALAVVIMLIIVPFGLDSYQPLVFGWIPWWVFAKWILFVCLAGLNGFLWLEE